MRLPYTLDGDNCKGEYTDCYMTDDGLNWFYNFLRSKSLPFLRETFPSTFSRLSKDIKHVDFETYDGLNNFRGTKGITRKVGTLQRALIERRVKRCVRKYEFDTIAEARRQLMLWLRYYPAEEFTLYRVRVQRGYTVKEKIPLVVDNGNRRLNFDRKGGTND